MGRKPKNPEDAFTYELRTKVKKSVFEEIDREAEARGMDRSQLVREATMKLAAELKAQREEREAKERHTMEAPREEL